jgi:D-beta-D-heptose 7-phosphate kinase/D-beta-D-heptose 1-phosphate adenosyltransferase
MAIWNRREAVHRIAEKRAQGNVVVFTNGCFDLLHPGHVAYLQAARNLGDFLVVGLNSDHSLRRLKGENRPLINQEGRAQILDALRMVDAVVIFNEDTPAALIQELKPDILVKGGDYEEQEIVGAETVKQYGGRVEIIPLVEGFSTSRLIQKIKGEKP